MNDKTINVNTQNKKKNTQKPKNSLQRTLK